MIGMVGKIAKIGAIVIGSLLALASGRARAQSPTVASEARIVVLLPIEAEGLLEADRVALERRIRPAFEHPQIRLITPSDPVACTDEDCLLEIGHEHGAHHVVRTVILAEGRDYVARIDVLFVAEGELVDTIDASCQICGLAEFDDRLAARAMIAREWILATPVVGRLLVVGGPQEARVRIDGRWRGNLPYSGDLGVGSHRLIVAAGGYFRRELPIETLAGVEQRLDVRLIPKPVQSWQRSVGWASLGVGLGSLTLGAILIGVDGQPIRCPGQASEVDGDCVGIRQTSGAGIAMAVVGGVSTAVGVSLLVVDHRRRYAHQRVAERAPEVRARLGLGRVALWIRF